MLELLYKKVAAKASGCGSRLAEIETFLLLFEEPSANFVQDALAAYEVVKNAGCQLSALFLVQMLEQVDL